MVERVCVIERGGDGEGVYDRQGALIERGRQWRGCVWWTEGVYDREGAVIEKGCVIEREA